MHSLKLVLVASLAATPLSAAQEPAPAPATEAVPAPTPSPERTTQPLPIESLVRDALETSLGLRSSLSATRGIESNVEAARAAFDPFLELTPFYSRGDREFGLESTTATGTESGYGAGGGVSGTLPFSTGYSVRLAYDRLDADESIAQGLQPSANTALTATLRQPLLKGAGSTYAQAGVRIARLGASAAQDRLDRTVELTIADVETFYWSLGLAESFESIARESKDRAQQLLDRNQRMFDLELITEVDLISARRGLQQRLTALTDAVRRRQDAAERLWYYVYGEKAESEIAALRGYHTMDPPNVAPALPDEDQALKSAASVRSDLAAARLDEESAGLSLRVARNALLPDLGLTASYTKSTTGASGFSFTSSGRLGELASDDWRLGLGFTFPLGNKAARAARTRASHDLEIQELAVAQTENVVSSEVRATTRAVRTELERLEQARLGLEYARAQYDASQKQLQLGLIDSFRLLQVEEDVSAAELTYSQVRYDLAQAITNYRLAMGTLRAQYANAPVPGINE